MVIDVLNRSAVSDEPTHVGSHGLLLGSIQRNIAFTDLILAVFGQYEIAVVGQFFVIFDSVNHQHANRLVAAETEVAVDAANDVNAKLLFSRSCLLGKHLRSPSIAVLVTVACHNSCILVSGINLHYMNSVSVFARCIVENYCLLGNAWSNCIFLL